ncbi:hypothetical protein [Streptomyces sp. NBC_01727]|nr:hypothetical protein OIE76_17840 [Streptomyces sp. NBC_01727]
MGEDLLPLSLGEVPAGSELVVISAAVTALTETAMPQSWERH